MKISQRIILCEVGGIAIWYLADCHGQEETQALALCRNHLSKAAAKDIFVLTYDRMRRYEGAWHMEEKLLFPSYILFDSEDGVRLAKEIGRLGFQGDGIGRRGVGLVRVNQDAEKLLKRLYGKRRHMEMSKGIIRNGIPQVTAGPLKGMEQRICMIDRHKRLAKLAVPTRQGMGVPDGRRKRYKQEFGFITAGLEITEKHI